MRRPGHHRRPSRFRMLVGALVTLVALLVVWTIKFKPTKVTPLTGVPMSIPRPDVPTDIATPPPPRLTPDIETIIAATRAVVQETPAPEVLAAVPTTQSGTLWSATDRRHLLSVIIPLRGQESAMPQI